MILLEDGIGWDVKILVFDNIKCSKFMALLKLRNFKLNYDNYD